MLSHKRKSPRRFLPNQRQARMLSYKRKVHRVRQTTNKADMAKPGPCQVFILSQHYPEYPTRLRFTASQDKLLLRFHVGWLVGFDRFSSRQSSKLDNNMLA